MDETYQRNQRVSVLHPESVHVAHSTSPASASPSPRPGQRKEARQRSAVRMRIVGSTLPAIHVLGSDSSSLTTAKGGAEGGARPVRAGAAAAAAIFPAGGVGLPGRGQRRPRLVRLAASRPLWCPPSPPLLRAVTLTSVPVPRAALPLSPAVPSLPFPACRFLAPQPAGSFAVELLLGGSDGGLNSLSDRAPRGSPVGAGPEAEGPGGGGAPASLSGRPARPGLGGSGGELGPRARGRE